jgi:hypothetical protein
MSIGERCVDEVFTYTLDNIILSASNTLFPSRSMRPPRTPGKVDAKYDEPLLMLNI